MTTTASPVDLDAIATLIGPAAVSSTSGLVLGSIVGGVGHAPDTALPDRISPASGHQLFTAGETSDLLVQQAVGVARRESDGGAWARATGRARAKVLYRTAELLEASAEPLARLLVAETGKPIVEARGEVGATVNAFEYFAGLARDINGRTATDIATDLLALTLRGPAGVAGLLIPWNFPMGILGQKLPPALAAGCTAVVKPSPLTPLSSLVVNHLLQAGLPADAVSVVLGGGAVGGTVVEHPDVDVVSFTGSTTTGRVIAANAGKNRLKRVAMEAGGKTPVVVFADADLDRAIERILFHSFFNSGQVCVAGSRILAEQPIADELGRRLAARAAHIVQGDPYQASTEMGPLVSQAHFDGVLGAVERATADGAELLTGGRPGSPSGTAASPFLQPTVLRTQSDDNVAVSEELFGPVTVVQSFADRAEAIRRANDSAFGLAASVWTSDLETALEVTSSLKTGTVWINGSTDAHPEIPLGGRRDSGYGAEFGREGMEFFTDIKTVHIARSAASAWYTR